MSEQRVTRVLGGSPGSVIVRLLLASIIVGALMAMLGLDPQRLVMRVVHLFQELIDTGWDAFATILRWAVYGAVIVVPLWALSRLIGGRR
ncbi:MAG: DUF6460 domain-containing protein [Beijerinckiaceae bacterium]